VKEKRFTAIQTNFAAWIALYRTQKTHGNAYWTFIGRALRRAGELCAGLATAAYFPGWELNVPKGSPTRI